MRIFLVFYLWISFTLITSAQEEKFNAIRIDFLRSGNVSEELISIRQIALQNNLSIGEQAYVDSINYGFYKIEAYSISNHSLFFKRGYSALFNEWVTTDDAKNMNRSFEESVLIPFVEDSIQIIFYYRDKSNKWHKQFDFSFYPLSAEVNRNHFLKYPVENLSIKGAAEKKLDILILPDGYTAEEMPDFLEDAIFAMNSIIESKPFNEYIDDINFRAVLAASEQSGTDFPHRNIWKRTLLNTSFNTFGTERYLTTLSYHALMDVAANAPADHILVLVNTKTYGGAGFYNHYSLAAAKNDEVAFLIEHEMGHGLSGLADEYYTDDVAVQDYHPTHVEPWEPNITSLVDFKSKWDSLIEDETPIPTPDTKEYYYKTGAFEGAGYVAKGLYRPAHNCTMKSVGYDNFCEVCRESISLIIRWYAH